MVLILLTLGGAYGWSAARSIQQQATTQLLGDLSYFVPGARQALRASDPSMIESEFQRYAELYGTQVTVFDRSGTVWAGSDTEDAGAGTSAPVQLALSGRRGEPEIAAFPWERWDTVIVEPVFDDDSVIGAVRIAQSPEAHQRAILTQWIVLLLGGAVVIIALIWAVYRLASWVLKPLHRVDTAMAAIEHGEMSARISDDTGPPEVQRMVRMFNQMAEEIERVMTRQQEFVLNASHELRNPLGALLMRVEYLATGLDEGWETDIEHAREEGRRMTRILDTLLNVARVGKTDSSFAAVDLRELIGERVSAWAERGAGQGIALLALPGTPVLSVTDRTAVESALDAIIDNALKFAPTGSTVAVSVDESDGGRAIRVRDRGRGLTPEQLELATGRFWRNSLDQNVPGSGLGLAIAADLMETVGGSLLLDSPQGGGLRVSLVLPAARPELGRLDA